MTSKDWRNVVILTVTVSAIAGIGALVYIVVKNRNKLKIKTLQKLIQEDLAYWKGITETSEKGAKKLVEYWKSLGHNYSVSQLRSSSFQSKHFWSAVYISDLMKRWGAGDRFEYSTSHSKYIIDGIQSRALEDDKLFRTFRPNEVSIEVGDIVAKSRKSGVVYDNVYVGAPTHTDVVFKIVKTNTGYTAYLIGGNLSQTVKVTEIQLDKHRKLINPEDYLAIMKNQDT